MGEEISRTEQEENAEGRAQKITKGIGTGVRPIRGKDEADDDDFRAEQDAQSQRGADRDGVKHESIVEEGFSRVHPTISLQFRSQVP